jgi:crotonobetainyl-CoA:carnitine CoA-transferase CaiB-like acyl-CoA transferase
MGPLKGIRILDFTRLLPGPVCTHLLTRLGANVTKVEGKGIGQSDYVRDSIPIIEIDENRKHSLLFESLHAGKRGLSIDLKHKDSSLLLKKIIKNYDVLVIYYKINYL